MKSEMRGIIEAQRIERRWLAARRVSPARSRPGFGVGEDALIRSLTSGRAARAETDRASSPAGAAVPSPAPALVPGSPKRTTDPDMRYPRGGVRSRPRRVSGRPLIAYLYRRDLPILAAIPLAPVLLALLFPVLGAFDFYARQLGVRMPAADSGELAMQPVATDARGGDAPMSVDATTFEQIRRTEYTVQPGDTISEIAVRFGLDTGTILSMNPVDDVRRLLPGTVLSIPDRDGLFHAVQPGESLSRIAASYEVPVYRILDANNLETDVLQVGDTLFIPGARMAMDDYLLAIGELLSWPVRSFRLTSGFGMRLDPITRQWRMHNGIDMANAIGTPVLAARSGRVVHIEANSGTYGHLIILDHGNGIRTLYAHLNSFAVSAGQWVSTGQMIGRMGNTGRSTGPHLHFSVIRNGRWIDPMGQLVRR